MQVGVSGPGLIDQRLEGVLRIDLDMADIAREREREGMRCMDGERVGYGRGFYWKRYLQQD